MHHKNTIEDLMKAAAEAKKQGQDRLAIDYYSHALRLDPYNTIIYNQRGTVYGIIWVLDRNQKWALEAAFADFKKMVTINPKSHIGYHNLGVICDRKGEYDDAITYYTNAIQIYPESESFYGRGRDYLETKDYKKAIADFSEAIKLNTDLNAHRKRAVCYQHCKEYTKAIDDYCHAINIKQNKNIRCDFLYTELKGVIREIRSDIDFSYAYFAIQQFSKDKVQEFVSLLKTCAETNSKNKVTMVNPEIYRKKPNLTFFTFAKDEIDEIAAKKQLRKEVKDCVDKIGESHLGKMYNSL